MANENVGGIQYTVDAETSGLIQAEATTKKFAQNTAKSLGQAEAATKKFNGQVTATAKGVKSASPNMSNFSYQLQDIAVQAQMGVNPLIIMTQQLPQLAVGMGGAAAAIGAAIAVVGVLATSLIDTTSSMDKMEKAIEQVKAVMTVGADGVANYTEEMQNLARISEVLASAKLDAAIVAQEKALTEGLKAMEESFRDFGSFYDDRATKIAENTKLPISALNDLDRAFRLQGAKVGQDDIQRFEDAIEALRAGLPDANKKGREMFATLTNLVAELSVGAERLEKMTGATDDVGAAVSTTTTQVAEMTNAFVTTALELTEGERAAFKFQLQLKGLTQEQIQGQLALYDYNQELEQQIEKTDRASQALEDEIDAWIKVGDEAERAADRKQKAQARELEQLTGQVQNIGLTPEEEIQAQYERELELLQQAQEKEVEIRGTYSERIKQIETEKNQRLKTLREQEAKNSESFLATYGDALNSINGLFGSYVNSMDKDTKKSFEKWKKFATAQALVSTLLAVSNALATPAPWPIPLIMAGVAGAAGALNVAQIRSQSFDGAREFGGPVTAGKSYLVGERGPEMFTPGTSGGITSNKDMNGSGGGGMTVNISNNTPYEVFVTRDEAANIANVQIGREAGKLASGRGQMASAMKKGAGTQFNGAN